LSQIVLLYDNIKGAVVITPDQKITNLVCGLSVIKGGYYELFQFTLTEVKRHDVLSHKLKS
jgi:hypothetical protein